MLCARNWVSSSEASSEKIMMIRTCVPEFTATTNIRVEMSTEATTRKPSLALMERRGSSGRRSAQTRCTVRDSLPRRGRPAGGGPGTAPGPPDRAAGAAARSGARCGGTSDTGRCGTGPPAVCSVKLIVPPWDHRSRGRRLQRVADAVDGADPAGADLPAQRLHVAVDGAGAG